MGVGAEMREHPKVGKPQVGLAPHLGEVNLREAVVKSRKAEHSQTL